MTFHIVGLSHNNNTVIPTGVVSHSPSRHIAIPEYLSPEIPETFSNCIAERGTCVKADLRVWYSTIAFTSYLFGMVFTPVRAYLCRYSL